MRDNDVLSGNLRDAEQQIKTLAKSLTAAQVKLQQLKAKQTKLTRC